ncbi:MAG TPA: hypothetical protein DCP92_03010 [Nitrospiraceae bacterium]|nr:hypothetical protein [Nitrospiraceae bacterium]
MKYLLSVPHKQPLAESNYLTVVDPMDASRRFILQPSSGCPKKQRISQGGSTVNFSLNIEATVSHVPHKKPGSGSCRLYAGRRSGGAPFLVKGGSYIGFRIASASLRIVAFT